VVLFIEQGISDLPNPGDRTVQMPLGSLPVQLGRSGSCVDDLWLASHVHTQRWGRVGDPCFLAFQLKCTCYAFSSQIPDLGSGICVLVSWPTTTCLREHCCVGRILNSSCSLLCAPSWATSQITSTFWVQGSKSLPSSTKVRLLGSLKLSILNRLLGCPQS
jgi:hypothetical protein